MRAQGVGAPRARRVREIVVKDVAGGGVVWLRREVDVGGGTWLILRGGVGRGGGGVDSEASAVWGLGAEAGMEGRGSIAVA